MGRRIHRVILCAVSILILAACSGKPSGAPSDAGEPSVPGAVLGGPVPIEVIADASAGGSAVGSGSDNPGPVRISRSAADSAPAEPAEPASSADPAPPAITDENFSELVDRHRPNELGRVLILEYHHIGDEEERWTRQRDNFRRDLKMLYEKGYRAVNLKAYLTDTMNLPPGTSPVIFTFDDSSISQFTWKDGGPDPQSAVGIMMAFHAEHPDFGLAGTFYVNFTPVPFREEESWQEKIRFLARNGFEIANHTADHDDLSSLTDQQVQAALAEQVRRLRELLPDYDGGTLALPFGAWPANRELAVTGEWEGVRYHHTAVLLVGADPAYSVHDRRHDPLALPRVQAIAPEFERWMGFLDEHRYISDGDPRTITAPVWAKEHLDPGRTGGRSLRFYPQAD